MAKGIKFSTFLVGKSLKDSDRAEAYFTKCASLNLPHYGFESPLL